MKTGILFSGGKDSCLALHKFGREKIHVLLSMLPEDKDSWMFHKPDEKLLKKQAEMLQIPLIIEETEGEKEKELEDLKKLIKKSKISTLIIGGIRSNYQGERIKGICQELKIQLVSPLWGYTEEKLWQELLENKFQVTITKISCDGIPKEFLGKIINKKRFSQLNLLAKKFKFRLDFEGGEAETSVLFMPGFKKPIKIFGKIKSEDKYRHFLIMDKVE